MSSSLQGTAQLTAQLRKLGKLDDGKTLRKVVRDAIRPAQKRAQALIPVGNRAHRTYKGRLVGPGFAKRNVVVITKLSKDKQSASALLGVRREAFYAVNFVEIGTSIMAAQPWLRPAFSQTRSEQEQAMKEGLRSAIFKAIR